MSEKDESEPPEMNDPDMAVPEVSHDGSDAGDSERHGHEKYKRADTVDGALSPGSTATGAPTGRD